MFRRILVTLDGSSFAEAALPVAVGLARRTGGEVRLLSVQDPGWAYVNDNGWTFADESAGEAARKSARRYLADRSERIERSDGGVRKVSAVVREGYTVEEVLDEADAFAADVIVMATHGRGPLRRLWLGSVADKVARRTRRPTLLVRPDVDAAQPGDARPLRRVVLPLDGSEVAERALARAKELAILFHCPLALVRVVLDPTGPDFRADPARLEEDRARAEAALEALARPIRAWGFDVTTHVPVATDLAAAIVGEAAGDLIVMATHGRTGVARAFMGSVADAVVRAAAGPVMLVPPAVERVRRPVAHGSAA